MADHVYRLFPLTGMLLLPGTFLPLNVFEPRYRKLVERALDDDRRIGMIQPTRPAPDHLGPGSSDPESPELYDVGCLGELVESERQEDGRYLIVLKGLSRFRVVKELEPSVGGYRRVEGDIGGFEHDADELQADFEVGEMLAAAGDFGRSASLDLDVDLLASLPPAQAVNALAAALPFEPAEKQALLEAETPLARRDLLVELLRFAVAPSSGTPEPPEGRPYEPPLVN